MMLEENIISIRKHDMCMANEAFADFMRKVEVELNFRANSDPAYFRTLSPALLEKVSVNCLKEIAPSTPFRPEEITLVSGLTFPDIIAETFYGVEVKSTQSNHWRSTGSSIIETTRNKNVESIYMLFGKLGGNPEFRCRPYEDCLYDITVTHSPRYLIDMNTDKDDTIFAKMHTSYDKLRNSKDSIAQVRRYYRDLIKKEKKNVMPWWLDETDDRSNSLIVRHITSITAEEKQNIIVQMYLLFPSSMIESNYVEPAMWLVTYHKIVCHNMRDYFSAGGKAKYLNGQKLDNPVPAIVKRFLDIAPIIKDVIDQMVSELDVFNPEILSGGDLYLNWVNQVDHLLVKRYGNTVLFKEWVLNEDKLAIGNNDGQNDTSTTPSLYE